MAVTIVSRTFGTEDRRIAISNGAFARTISIGSTWNAIRVGIRFSMTNTGADLAGNPVFAIGVCSGLTNIYGDATTANWVGAKTQGAYASWTYSAGPPKSYYAGSNSVVAAKKVGATITEQLAGALGPSYFVDAVAGIRDVFMVDITKGAPNYTVRAFGRSGTGAWTDKTVTDFLAFMEAGTPAATGYSWLSAQNIATDEVAGTFDSVNIAWNKSAAVWEVSDLAVARLS